MLQFRIGLIVLSMLFMNRGTTAQSGAGPFPDSRFTTVGGVKMHYRQLQPADSVIRGTVLLVHGFAGSTYSWRLITDTLLASGYEVILVDVPPFGYSDKNPDLNQSVSARGQLLRSFMLQEFPGRKWHLAGHSMGGGMVEALALLIREELDLKSVIIVDGVVFRVLEPKYSRPPFLLRCGLSRGLFLMAGKPLLVNRISVKKLLKSAYGRKPSKEETMGYLKPLKVRGTARAVLKSAVNYEELVSLHASDLNVPVLAIWGDRDTWVPAALYSVIIEEMQDSRLELIPGAAHCPMETHPEEFIKLIIPFLKKTDGH